jgi:hypothetical protein
MQCALTLMHIDISKVDTPSFGFCCRAFARMPLNLISQRSMLDAITDTPTITKRSHQPVSR